MHQIAASISGVSVNDSGGGAIVVIEAELDFEFTVTARLKVPAVAGRACSHATDPPNEGELELHLRAANIPKVMQEPIDVMLSENDHISQYITNRLMRLANITRLAREDVE